VKFRRFASRENVKNLQVNTLRVFTWVLTWVNTQVNTELGGKTGKYPGKNPGKYPVRYLPGIYLKNLTES